MGDSFYDMFLKEHEKYFPIHAMIQASTVKPKTPYLLEGNNWSWHPGMFEEVYPVQEQLSSKLPKIDLSCHLPLEIPSQEDKGELIVHQVDFGSMIEKTVKRIAAYSLVQGLDAKLKLKQIKTTHLIKLKKL